MYRNHFLILIKVIVKIKNSCKVDLYYWLQLANVSLVIVKKKQL